MINNIPSKGIIYCATGIQYLIEASKSAQSLKRASPDQHISLFTDQALLALAKEYGIFDNLYVLDDPSFSFRDKIQALQKSPYPDTIFLDSDTYVLEPLDDLFNLLDKFDIALAHEYGPGIIHEEESRLIPPSFPQLNTGVIAFKSSLNIKEFLIEWLNQYDKNINTYANDQCSFRDAVYKSTKIRIYILRPEYNFRIMFPGSVITKIKIIHDHNFLKLSKKKQQKVISNLNMFISKKFHPRPLLWSGESDIERPGHKVRIWLPNIGIISQEDIQKSLFSAICIFFKLILNTFSLFMKKLAYKSRDIMIYYFK